MLELVFCAAGFAGKIVSTEYSSAFPEYFKLKSFEDLSHDRIVFCPQTLLKSNLCFMLTVSHDNSVIHVFYWFGIHQV